MSSIEIDEPVSGTPGTPRICGAPMGMTSPPANGARFGSPAKIEFRRFAVVRFAELMFMKMNASAKFVVGIGAPWLSRIENEKASGVGPRSTFVVRDTWKLSTSPGINCWKNSLTKAALSVSVTAVSRSPLAPPNKCGAPLEVPPPKVKLLIMAVLTPEKLPEPSFNWKSM